MASECKQDALLIVPYVRLSNAHAQKCFLDSCLSKEKMDVFGKRVLYQKKVLALFFGITNLIFLLEIEMRQ